jgi:type III pantothenate kinase
LIVAVNDINALARAILRLMGDRVLAERMGRAGRERVERLFAIEKHVEQIQSIYHRCSRES